MDAALEAVFQRGMTVRAAAREFSVPQSSLHRVVAKRRGTAPVEQEDDSPKRSKEERKEAISAALEAIREQGMSTSGASRTFNVALSVLQRHKHNPNVKDKGGAFKFSPDLEKEVLRVLLNCQKIGIPLNQRRRLKSILATLGATHGLPAEPNPFSNKWYIGFITRHREILSENVPHAYCRREALEWNKNACEYWLALLSALNRDGHIGDPAGLWILEDNTFPMAEVWNKVAAARGTSRAIAKFDGDEKEPLTVLTCGNGAGMMLKPVVIFGEQVKELAGLVGVPHGDCHVQTSPSGSMGPQLLAEYIRSELLPNMTAERNVIFFDGKWSDLYNLELINLCANSGKNIMIVWFPTGDRQPFDKSVFGGVTGHWKALSRTNCDLVGLPQSTFPERLLSLWPKLNRQTTFPDGFANAGIFPYSLEKIRATLRQLPADSVSLIKERLHGPLAEMKLSPRDADAVVKFAEMLARGGMSEADKEQVIRAALLKARTPGPT